MASIFKLPRDAHKRNAPYWIEYTNAFGNRQRKKGFSQKRLTAQLAARLEDEVRQKTLGLVDPIQEGLRDHRTAPVDVHLDDYELHLGGGSRTVKHKTLTMSRIRKVIAETDVQTLHDLQLGKVDGYLDSLPKAKWGARTINHYVQAMQSWCRWLVKNNRLAANPLEGLTTQ
ncbi:MAG: hypothetical protein H0T51_26260, partial [Pirellulales bacterium]|nr:hypothetical protein [Pirellulales bacterium]